MELVVSNVEKTKGVFHKTRLDEALGKCINSLNSYVCEVDRGKPLVVCQNIDYNTFFSSKRSGLEKSRSFERSGVRPEVHNWDNGGSSLFTTDHSHLQNTLQQRVNDSGTKQKHFEIAGFTSRSELEKFPLPLGLLVLRIEKIESLKL